MKAHPLKRRYRRFLHDYVCPNLGGHRWGPRSINTWPTTRRCRTCRHIGQLQFPIPKIDSFQISTDISKFVLGMNEASRFLADLESRGRFRRRINDERRYARDWLDQLIDDTYADLGLVRP